MASRSTLRLEGGIKLVLCTMQVREERMLNTRAVYMLIGSTPTSLRSDPGEPATLVVAAPGSLTEALSACGQLLSGREPFRRRRLAHCFDGSYVPRACQVFSRPSTDIYQRR